MAKSRPVSLVRFVWTCIVLIITMIMPAGSVVTMAFVVSIWHLNYSSSGKEIELKKMLQIEKELSINIKESSNPALQLYRRTPPPPVQILSFLCRYWPKKLFIALPPEILDPPLNCFVSNSSNQTPSQRRIMTLYQVIVVYGNCHSLRGVVTEMSQEYLSNISLVSLHTFRAKEFQYTFKSHPKQKSKNLKQNGKT